MRTSDDTATAASELHAEIALFRLELVAFEARLRRNLIAWILIAHSVTVIVLSLLVLTLERSLR